MSAAQHTHLDRLPKQTAYRLEQVCADALCTHVLYAVRLYIHYVPLEKHFPGGDSVAGRFGISPDGSGQFRLLILNEA